jgi:hypothetical protein
MAGRGVRQFFFTFACYSFHVRTLRACLISVFTLCLSLPGASQKQLILLKKENVLLRLYPGDELIFKLKGNKSVITSYVANLYDNAVVAHRDTIPFNKIERIYFTQSKFYNRIGYLFVIGGAGLFLIDQLNLVAVQHQEPNFDSRVSAFSISALALGIPMILLKKKSQKLTYKYHLLTVKKGSLFYKEDPRGYISPFMDN